MMTLLKELRARKGWSQEHLAEISGVSGRTIQRLEAGESAALETAKALAAAFEVDHTIFLNPTSMQSEPEKILEEAKLRRRARKRVKAKMGFYYHALTYVFVILVLATVNLITRPEYLWFLWTAFGWGAGLSAHGFSVFLELSSRGKKWMDKEIGREMGKLSSAERPPV